VDLANFCKIFCFYLSDLGTKKQNKKILSTKLYSLGCSSFWRCKQRKTIQSIQCGNFINWNKIHNLDMGDFCKKSRNRSTFVFLCPQFGAYGFCISAPGSAQPPLTFFSNVTVCQVTPRLKGYFAINTAHYLLPEYVQSLSTC
jgi:hypothetical protein